MEDYENKILEYRLKGYCCSQILLQLGLDELEKDDPDLINAVKGLCGGLHAGLVCGALSGGACLLSLLSPQSAHKNMIPELVKWFFESFGSCNCAELLSENPANKIERCPVFVTKTYEKAKELLEELSNKKDG